MSNQAHRNTTYGVSTRLFLHGGIYGFEQVVQTVVAFILLPVYARYLGTEGYGTIGVLLSIGGVLSLLLLQGLGAAWFRLRVAPGIRDRLPEYQTTLILYLLGSVVLAGALFFVIGPTISRWVTPNIPFYPWWPWVFLIAASNVFATLYKNAARSDQKPVHYIAFTTLRQISTMGAILFMVMFLRAGALGQLQGTAFGGVVFAAATLFLFAPYRPNPHLRSDLKLSFAYGLPALPHTLAGPVNALIDRFVVNLLLGVSQTGVYVAGQQISRLAEAFALALNRAYAPIFNSLAQEAEEAPTDVETVDRNLRAIAEMGYVITLTLLAVGAGLIMISREVLLYLASPEFATAWRIILLLVGAEVMRTYYHIFGRAVHFSLETVRYLPLISWSSMLINLALNFVLIPLFGIIGAAMATLISQTALALFTLIVGRRRLKIPYPWGKMIIALVAFALTGAALTYCDATFDALALRLPIKLGVTLPFGLYSLLTLIRHLRASSAGRRLASS